MAGFRICRTNYAVLFVSFSNADLTLSVWSCTIYSIFSSGVREEFQWDIKTSLQISPSAEEVIMFYSLSKKKDKHLNHLDELVVSGTIKFREWPPKV
jgi:hypothetical protein